MSCPAPPRTSYLNKKAENDPGKHRGAFGSQFDSSMLSAASRKRLCLTYDTTLLGPCQWIAIGQLKCYRVGVILSNDNVTRGNDSRSATLPFDLTRVVKTLQPQARACGCRQSGAGSDQSSVAVNSSARFPVPSRMVSTSSMPSSTFILSSFGLSFALCFEYQ